MKISFVIYMSIMSIFWNTIYSQQFVNVADLYGIDSSYLASEYGGGVSFVDYNQDGWDDLSFATEKGSPLRMFTNNQTGFDTEISIVTDSSEVRQLLWVDYNNDYHLDLFIANEGKNKLYKNFGNQQFEDVTLELGFDFSKSSTYCSSWVDYDRDGFLDLVTTHRDSMRTGSIDLYKNHNGKTFEKVTTLAGLEGLGNSVLVMTTLDYNNDGFPDVFLGQDWNQGNQLLKNNGNGTFSEVSYVSGLDYEMNSMSATIVDINYDGFEDIYVTNTTEGNLLFVNQQDETFSEKSATYNLFLRSITFGAVFADFDNDTDDDLHIGGQRTNYMYECNASGIFENRRNEWSIASDLNFNTGVAVGDYNNDGRIDIARNSITREGLYSSTNSLLQNDLESQNFIKLNLKGTLSNSYAIGARIYVFDHESFQMKRIACGESFSSQHSYIQHFGLGTKEKIDSIIVKWPSGVVTRDYDLDANQSIDLVEPTSACTDSIACNYVPSALTDDGSCTYNETGLNCVWNQTESKTTSTDEISEQEAFILSFDSQGSQLSIYFYQQQQRHQINIFDLSGRLVYSLKSTEENQIDIDLDDLASGLYLVHVYSPKQKKTTKIFKH